MNLANSVDAQKQYITNFAYSNGYFDYTNLTMFIKWCLLKGVLLTKLNVEKKKEIKNQPVIFFTNWGTGALGLEQMDDIYPYRQFDSQAGALLGSTG